MRAANSSAAYGWVAVLLHWLLALWLLGLFALGWWMVDLDYYSPWYQRAPWWHKGLGVLAAMLMLARYGWRLFNPLPAAEPGMSRWEIRLALWGQRLFYLMVLLIAVSGYFIVTARGESLPVLGWFSLPASLTIAQQEDIAGWVHKYLAWGFMLMVLLHSVAALRHHFALGDKTLLKILGRE
ncbi:cytochrome b [Dasania marina]|uniref:cytochrome b n=1 Tax=Dasania marina TaxID=471499 RepID=UPI0003646A5D|nr:cytochrome b [Dasania marina]